MKNKLKNTKGFTLVELMLTVTIIGVLSAIAIPAYQDYLIKSQVSEAFIATETLKKEVENQKSLNNRFNINLVKINSQTMKVDEDGNVFYTFKNKNKEINNKAIMFYLDENNNGAFRWGCISDIDKKYYPSSFKCLYLPYTNTDNDNEIVEEEIEDWYNNPHIHRSNTIFSSFNSLYFESSFINEQNETHYAKLKIDANKKELSFTDGINDFIYEFSNIQEIEDIVFNNKNLNGKSLNGFVSTAHENNIAEFISYLQALTF